MRCDGGHSRRAPAVLPAEERTQPVRRRAEESSRGKERAMQESEQRARRAERRGQVFFRHSADRRMRTWNAVVRRSKPVSLQRQSSRGRQTRRSQLAGCAGCPPLVFGASWLSAGMHAMSAWQQMQALTRGEATGEESGAKRCAQSCWRSNWVQRRAARIRCSACSASAMAALSVWI